MTESPADFLLEVQRHFSEPSFNHTHTLLPQPPSACLTLLTKEPHLSDKQLIIIPQILIPTPKQPDLIIQVLNLLTLLAHEAFDQSHTIFVATTEA